MSAGLSSLSDDNVSTNVNGSARMLHVLYLADHLGTAALMCGANGTGDPNDSITAVGECANTSSSNAGSFANDQA